MVLGWVLSIDISNSLFTIQSDGEQSSFTFVTRLKIVWKIFFFNNRWYDFYRTFNFFFTWFLRQNVIVIFFLFNRLQFSISSYHRKYASNVVPFFWVITNISWWNLEQYLGRGGQNDQFYCRSCYSCSCHKSSWGCSFCCSNATKTTTTTTTISMTKNSYIGNSCVKNNNNNGNICDKNNNYTISCD